MIRRSVVPTDVSMVGPRKVRVRVSTAKVIAQDNLLLVPEGCDLSAYRKNPIWLRNHDPLLVTGRSEEVTIVPGAGIDALSVFAPEGISAVADETCGLVKSSIISAASIGFDFDPADVELIDRNRPQAGKRVNKWTLLECSWVAVGADPDALVTARAAGRRSLDAEETGLLIRARDLVDEAATRHHDVGVAIDRGDRKARDTAHRRLGVTLRAAQKVHERLADLGAQAGLDAAATVQTSSGAVVDKGSSPGEPRGWTPVHDAHLRRRHAERVEQLRRYWPPDLTPAEAEDQLRRAAEADRRALLS